MYAQGLSRTTVAHLRSRFAHLRYSANTSDPHFLEDINEVLEFLYSEGDWRGGNGVWSLGVSDSGRITLPYWLESIKAARLNYTPRPIASQSLEFLHHGPGDLEDKGLGILVSDGEFPIETEFPAATSDTIGVASSQAADATDLRKVRIYGLDQNGKEVRTATGSPGVEVTVGASSTTQFSAVTAVVKPITKGRITLTLETATPLVLSIYEPSVEIPIYHRYRVNPVSVDAENTTEIHAWCSRRFLPVTKEEDFVCPGAIRAWKLALMAQQQEENQDKSTSGYWASAIAAFNSDVAKFHHAERQSPAIFIHGLGVDPIPNLV